MSLTRIYPTCDVHLLLSDPAPPMNLFLLSYSVHANLSADPNTTVAFDPSIVTVVQTSVLLELTPNALGTTIGRVRYSDTSDPSDPVISEILVRVTVHQSIDSLWIGHNRITMPVYTPFNSSDGSGGETNCVISVYAKFDDGTIGDVTSHPYLNFSSTASDVVSVDNTAFDKGRLHARKATGSFLDGAVGTQLKVQHRSLSDNVQVFTPDRVSSRQLIELIHGTGDVADRRNLLFISDGFADTDNDRKLFHHMVEAVKNRLFQSPHHFPFKLLKDKFNVWKAFDPATESGISAALPVNATGTTVPYTPSLPDTNHLLQQRDSIFGLIYGQRAGDQSSETVNSASSSLADDIWYSRQTHVKFVTQDLRRTSLIWEDDLLTKYIESLENDVAKSSGVSIDPGAVWAEDSIDRPLVCILIQEDRRILTSGKDGIKLSFRPDDRQFTNIVIGPNGKADHSPDLAASILLGRAFGPRISVDEVTSGLVHELGHAFGLV